MALFLAIVTVSILWYLVKKLFPNEDRDVRFLLTFIGVVVPFVMLIYFGLAVINYDAIAAWSGWPQVLPVKKLVVTADPRYSSFLCRPNGVAMVGLAT